jgi:hypothetical protein
VSYIVAKKATLLIPSGPSQHLFVILTNPCDGGKCCVASFSSVKVGGKHDMTCPVAAGEHPSISKDSFIEYRLADVLPCDRIIHHVERWYYTPKAEVPDALFDRIRAGILTSDFTPRRVQSYFTANSHL